MKRLHLHRPWRCATDPDRSRDGAVMGVVLILVLVFSILGLGLLELSTSNAVATSKRIDRSRAFWAAEAGLKEARAQAAWEYSKDLDTEDLFFSLPQTWISTNTALPYTVTLTDLNTTPPSFHIRSQGQSPGGARFDVEVDLLQTNALPVGLFAVNELRVRKDIKFRSYNSSYSWNPFASLSSIRIGANGVIDLPTNAGDLNLDGGTVARGTDPYTGAQAVLDCDPNCEGFSAVDAGDIKPDPLGISPPGPLAHRFDEPVVWTDLTIPSGTTNAPPLVSGDYYFHDILLETNATLLVDVSGGPVNVLLTGSFVAREDSLIDVNNGEHAGRPSDFRIFANGTHPDRIDLNTTVHWGLFIYAPGLFVHVETDGPFLGGAWGRDVDIQVPDDNYVFIDRRLFDYGAFSYDDLPHWHLYRLVFANWNASSE